MSQPKTAVPESDGRAWYYSARLIVGGSVVLLGLFYLLAVLMAPPGSMLELELVRDLSGPQTVVEFVGFAGEREELVVAAGEKGIVVWNRESGEQIRHFGDPVQCGALSPDRAFLYGGVGPDVVIYDLQTEKVVHRFAGDEGKVYSLAISSDGRYLITGNGFAMEAEKGTKQPKIVLWEIGQRKKVRTYSGHLQAVQALAWMPNAKEFISHSARGSWRLWSIDAADPAATDSEEYTLHFVRGMQYRRCLAIAPDGSAVFTGERLLAGNTLKPDPNWKLSSNVQPQYHDNWGEPICAAFLRVGELIATAHGHGAIRVWDAKSGKNVANHLASGNTSPIYSMALSSDGRYLITGGKGEIAGFEAIQQLLPAFDRKVRVWKLNYNK